MMMMMMMTMKNHHQMSFMAHIACHAGAEMGFSGEAASLLAAAAVPASCCAVYVHQG
jgi:hypothetical protein